MRLTPYEMVHKEMTSKEKYGDRPQRMDFARANNYLQDLKIVFSKVGIKFFLFYGTLVGAIRDNDFPWLDDDVDVGMFFEDTDKFVAMEGIFKDMGYYVCFGPKIQERFISGYIAKRGFVEKVDFYVLLSFNKERCFYRFARDNHAYYIPYPQRYFDNLKEIFFKGEKYLVPNPPEDFLTYMWGNWRIPKGGQFGIVQHQKVIHNKFIHGGSL